jgi:small subunit ribosomal protein S18
MAAKAKRGKSTADSRTPTRPRAGLAPGKRKSCFLCRDHVREVDYKDVEKLRRYMSDKGKIRTRRMTGACRKHQRQVAVAIKRAREMALLPYIAPNDAAPRGRGQRDGRNASSRGESDDA